MTSSEAKIVLAFDQRTEQEGKKSWKANFQYFLSMLLSQVLGYKPNLVRLDPNDGHAEQHVNEAVIFIAILSESFRTDDFLINMCNQFADSVQAKNRLNVGGKSSFFKIHALPMKNLKALSFADTISSYDFYDVDKLTAKPRTFDQRIGSATQHYYWLKLSDVCYNISYILRCLAGEIEEETSARRTVYIADVAGDMITMRDRISRELMQRGYRVLPNKARAHRAADIRAAMQQDLQESVLAVHLIGELYGATVLDGETSIVSLHDQIAHQHTLSVIEQRKQDPQLPPFRRLIWLNPEIEHLDELQRIFIENLKTEASTIEEAEVVEVSFAEFMFIVRDTLAKQQVMLPAFDLQRNKTSDQDFVYVMHDYRDKSAVASLVTLLIDEGLRVKALSRDGSPAELRYEHQEHLRTCSGCIIYMKKMRVQWFGSRLQDLFKSPAFGRKEPIRAKAILFDCSVDFDTTPLQEYATVINGMQGISLSTLGPFIQDVKNNQL